MIKLKNILTEKKELSKSIVDDIAKMTDRNCLLYTSDAADDA